MKTDNDRFNSCLNVQCSVRGDFFSLQRRHSGTHVGVQASRSHKKFLAKSPLEQMPKDPHIRQRATIIRETDHRLSRTTPISKNL